MPDGVLDFSTGRPVASVRFVKWQCALRLRAMREHAGRPSPGMCPEVGPDAGDNSEIAAKTRPAAVANPMADSGADPLAGADPAAAPDANTLAGTDPAAAPDADTLAGTDPVAAPDPLAGADPITGKITALLLYRQPELLAARLFQMVKGTHDPRLRMERALRFFCGSYYLSPERFSDRLTAVFPADSARAARLRAAGACRLAFAERGVEWRLGCRVAALAPDDPASRASRLHNHLFNPHRPPAVVVLSFEPDWARAVETPAP